MAKEEIEKQASMAQNDFMSLQWNSRAREIDNVRPAGDGPLMQEFYSQVAEAMREQHARALEEVHFNGRVARTVRGSEWRTWVTGAIAGFAAGSILEIALHWVR